MPLRRLPRGSIPRRRCRCSCPAPGSRPCWGLARACDRNAVAKIPRDQVARRGDHPADGVVAGATRWRPALEVAKGLGPGSVGADVVALDQVVVRDVGDLDAVAVVAGNDVASPGRGAADRVVIRKADLDAVARVDNGLGAGGVGADVVALDQVVDELMIRTPSPPLPEMRLRALGVVPPIVLSPEKLISMPLPALKRA